MPQKTKLKVLSAKVDLVFRFEAYFRSYGHFRPRLAKSPKSPFFAEIATSGSPVLILFGILPFRDKKTKAQKLVEVKMTKVTTKSALDTPVGRRSVYPPILTSGWTTKQALFQFFLS